MSMAETVLLPEGFAELADLASRWARPTESERSAIRWAATAGQFAELHAAMMPRLEAILTELAGCSLDGMDAPHSNLFHLAAAFAEAAPHHELYGGSSSVPFSFAAERFVPGHGDVPSASNMFK